MRVMLAFATVVLTACTTISTRDADIFQRPEAYLGQEVTVCGYVRSAFEDNNIWTDRNAWSRRPDVEQNVSIGLRPQPYDLLIGKHNRRACVTGELVRTGCGAETICADSNSPYAIRVTG